MFTPENLVEGESYPFPHPKGVGFIRAIVLKIFEEGGKKYVRYQSLQTMTDGTPLIEDFCTEVNLANALTSSPC